jgi:2-hydroxymuconate-semialdehyde hydrolase
MSFAERNLTVEGYRVHYLESGTGYPVLLLHGSGPGASTIGNWRRVLDPLAQRFHVYAMDLIGFGRSDRKREQPYFDMALWLRQCRAVIDIMPGAHIGVVGHSLSGALALKLATLEPRVAQVLTTASMGAPFKLNDAVKKVWTFPQTRDELQRTAEVLIHDKSLIDDAYLDARMNILHKDNTYGPYFSAMFSGDRQAYVDQTVLTNAELSGVRCKVAMLHGRDDVGFPPSITLDIAQRLPHADVTLLGQCSHSVAMEQADKFLAVAYSLFPIEPTAADQGHAC